MSPPTKCDENNELHTLVIQSCKKYPSQIAIIHDDGVNLSYITYTELSLMIDQLTNILSYLNVPYSVVGYFGCQNPGCIALFISLLKESSAFVALYLDAPSKNEELINSVGIKYIFADERYDKIGDKRLGCPVEKCQVISLTHGKLYILKVMSTPVNNIKNHKLKRAYVVMTSGTMGIQKVIHVPHECIVPNIKDISQIFALTPADVVFLNAPLTFDPSVVEIFMTLASGASLLVVPDILKVNSLQFLDLITERHRVTVLMATPSSIKRIGHELVSTRLLGRDSPLRILCFGGEMCPSVPTLKKWIGQQHHIALYNIYGITEVSSWATLHRITPEDLQGEDGGIPLGTPLNSTEIDIRDSSGLRIDYGEGNLYVGGRQRVCYIDDEDDDILQSGIVFRDTGDSVLVKPDGKIYFMYRRDDQVKRFGKKVSLTMIEDVTSTFDWIENSCAIFDGETQYIGLFIVLKNRDELNEALRRELDQQLQFSLPSHFIPNNIAPIPVLPLTKNGKVDYGKLLQLARYEPEPPESYSDYVAEEWKRLLDVDSVDKKDNFIECGGDSIQIIQLAEDVSTTAKRSLPRLVDLLLTRSFGDVCVYVEENVKKVEVVENKDLDNYEWTIKNRNTPSDTMCSQKGKKISLQLGGSVSFKLLWKFNLNKCIDASPLIIGSKGNAIVFIGSHSHEFAAIDLESGNKKWITELGDRIESSACASLCGSFIVVGCYDHFVYCLLADTGEIKWKFQTESQVKCSPIADPVSGNVLIGSHDHYIYNLNIDDGKCIWKTSPAQGSVFASPCVSQEPYRVYVATLDGLLTALEPTNGCKLWELNLEKPIFASPVAEKSSVLVATVKGELHRFTHSGKNMWTFSTKGPTFSSPCVVDNKFVLFGCHDYNFYCVLLETGDVHWVIQMNSAIYSSPFTVQNIAENDTAVDGGNDDMVVIASVKGEVKLVSVKSGQVMSCYDLSGEVFSSPVIFSDKLVIGCRDNFVHCLHFTSE